MIGNISSFFSLRTEISNFILEYVEWKAKTISVSTASTDQKNLTDFIAHCGKKSLSGIEYKDLEAYRMHLAILTSSKFRVLQNMRSINCLLRYAQARGHECISPVTFSEDEVLSMVLNKDEYMSSKKEAQKRRVGRPSVDPDVLKRVKFLKENTEAPLSYRQIARALSKDHAQIVRLYKRSKEMNVS